MHICMDFADVGLGSNSLINSEIDEVLTVDLALGEMIASWPPATRVTLSLIQIDPPPASSQAGEFLLVPQQLNPYSIQIFSVHPQRNDLIPHFLRISSAPPLTWMRCAGQSRAILRTNWRTTCDDGIDGKHIAWQMTVGSGSSVVHRSPHCELKSPFCGGGQRQEDSGAGGGR